MYSFLQQEYGGSVSSSDIFQMYKGEQAILAANEPAWIGRRSSSDNEFNN
jgi:hypothetical protein